MLQSEPRLTITINQKASNQKQPSTEDRTTKGSFAALVLLILLSLPVQNGGASQRLETLNNSGATSFNFDVAVYHQGRNPKSPLEYSLMETENVKGQALVLDGTLSSAPDRATLLLLSDKIYEEFTGIDYEQVLITWRLKNQSKKEAPWAISDLTREDTVLKINPLHN